MARLFGTDGIRGIANELITSELAMKTGRSLASVLMKGQRRRPLVVIGKDTRVSSGMLENAMTAGLCSVGADVILLGFVPTPAVAYLVKHYKADAGVMISASHNAYQYNGIKLFDGEGFKLPDEVESRIEGLILDEDNQIPLANSEEIGTVIDVELPAQYYIEHLKSSIHTNLEGLHVAVDCANGSASVTAKDLFEQLGAKADILCYEPDGLNINDGCGSTHMEKLQAYVLEHKLDAGIAFDGDADRCLYVDEKGNIVDGDFTMAICALDMKERGKLRKNTVVGTVMTNMGFQKFCEKHGIHFIATKVGDRYVLEELEMEDYSFGGEQSGHIIFRDFATTGDGQLTAIQLLCHMKNSGKKLSKLASVMTRYPQVMVNVEVTRDGKLRFHTNRTIKSVIKQHKNALKDTGRVVVRISGTEPLIRVMVEGEDKKKIQAIAKDIAETIEQELAKE